MNPDDPVLLQPPPVRDLREELRRATARCRRAASKLMADHSDWMSLGSYLPAETRAPSLPTVRVATPLPCEQPDAAESDRDPCEACALTVLDPQCPHHSEPTSTVTPRPCELLESEPSSIAVPCRTVEDDLLRQGMPAKEVLDADPGLGRGACEGRR